MENFLQSVSDNIENIPGYGIVSELYEDKAEEHFHTKDPFYQKVPGKDDKTVRRRPPDGITEKQRKLWKKIIKRAWYHDRNFCNCTPLDIGLGMIPVVSIFPVIGPIIAYYMHGKMTKLVVQAGGPASLVAKMAGNVASDFFISLIPVLGTIFSWMFAASTRNAALFDTWLRKSAAQSMNKQEAVVTGQRQQQAALQADVARRRAQGDYEPSSEPPPPQAAARPGAMQHTYQPSNPYATTGFESREMREAHPGYSPGLNNRVPSRPAPPPVPGVSPRVSPQSSAPRPPPHGIPQSPRYQSPYYNSRQAPSQSLPQQPLNHQYVHGSQQVPQQRLTPSHSIPNQDLEDEDLEMAILLSRQTAEKDEERRRMAGINGSGGMFQTQPPLHQHAYLQNPSPSSHSTTHHAAESQHHKVHRRPVPNMHNYPAPNTLHMPSPSLDNTYN